MKKQANITMARFSDAAPPMLAIPYKYYGPTDKSGARHVFRASGKRITVGFDHAGRGISGVSDATVMDVLTRAGYENIHVGWWGVRDLDGVGHVLCVGYSFGSEA
jgi:hypothetical protein